MNTHRMAVGLCALFCVLATGFFAGPEAASAASQKTAKVEKQIDLLEKKAKTYVSRIKFFKENPERRWMLHQRYSHLPCWKVPLKGPERLCAISRGVVRVNSRKLRQVQSRIANLEEQLMYIGNQRNWLCIHREERDPNQGWRTDTGNGYYGGLQMDISFQKAHGLDLYISKGTANNWTWREQMMVAQRAHDGVRTSYDEDGKVVFWKDSARGYHPWPNTAKECGLI